MCTCVGFVRCMACSYTVSAFCPCPFFLIFFHTSHTCLCSSAVELIGRPGENSRPTGRPISLPGRW